MQLTKNFKFREFTKSAIGNKHGIANVPNTQEKESIEYLVTKLIQPVRDLWGKPIIINSGFRNEEINKLVGGVSSSQHRKGEAADITTGNAKDNKKLFDLIVNSALEWDQLIDEKNYRWLHLSLKRDNNRKQILHL